MLERSDLCHEAHDAFDAALALHRTLGNRLGEAAARNGLGEAALAADTPDRAVAEHTAALLLAAESRSRPERARAHEGLARAEQRLARLGEAREHAGRAAELYEQLDVPEAADARALRDSLGAD